MPIIKLFGVAIRSLSKPISTYVKNHLQDSPTFAKIMTKIGHKYQKITNFMTGIATHELGQSRAITLGSEITVEFLFFSIGGGLVIYDHQASKEKTKQLNSKIKALEHRVQILEEIKKN